MWQEGRLVLRHGSSLPLLTAPGRTSVPTSSSSPHRWFVLHQINKSRLCWSPLSLHKSGLCRPFGGPPLKHCSSYNCAIQTQGGSRCNIFIRNVLKQFDASRRVSFFAGRGVVKSETLKYIVREKRKARLVMAIGAFGLALGIVMCFIFSNSSQIKRTSDRLVGVTVSLLGVPLLSSFAAEALSVLCVTDENRRIAINAGVLTKIYSMLSEDDQITTIEALRLLSELSLLSDAQEMIFETFGLLLDQYRVNSHLPIAFLASSALARLALHASNQRYYLSQGMAGMMCDLASGGSANQLDASKALYALSSSMFMMDAGTRAAYLHLLCILLLSQFHEPKAFALHTVAQLARSNSLRPELRELGCVSHIMLCFKRGHLDDLSHKWALKALRHFAQDTELRDWIGNSGMSAIAKSLGHQSDKVRTEAARLLTVLIVSESNRSHLVPPVNANHGGSENGEGEDAKSKRKMSFHFNRNRNQQTDTVARDLASCLQSSNLKLRISAMTLLINIATREERRRRFVAAGALNGLSARMLVGVAIDGGNGHGDGSHLPAFTSYSVSSNSRLSHSSSSSSSPSTLGTFGKFLHKLGQVYMEHHNNNHNIIH